MLFLLWLFPDYVGGYSEDLNMPLNSRGFKPENINLETGIHYRSFFILTGFLSTPPPQKTSELVRYPV